MILCVVGPTCSGKTTACNHIERTYDIPYIEAGNIVRSKYHSSDAFADLQRYVWNKYKEEGLDVFAPAIYGESLNVNSKHKIICGCRTPEEIDYIRNRSQSQIVVLGIVAESSIRYQRFCRRSQDISMSYRKFAMRDRIEYYYGISEVLSQYTDVNIINDGNMSYFFERIDTFLENSTLLDL